VQTTQIQMIDFDSSVELALAMIAAEEARRTDSEEECRGPHCPGELLDAAGWPGESNET
jgi:hypothetical protein